MPVMIYKYPLPAIENTVEIPGANPVFRMLARDPATTEPVVWFEVDTDSEVVSRFLIRVFGTGHPIDSGYVAYLGSLFQSGIFVWHYYAYRL